MARCFPLMKSCRFPVRHVRGTVQNLVTANACVGRNNITNCNSQRHKNIIAVEPIVLSEQPPKTSRAARTCVCVLERVGQQRGGKGSGCGRDIGGILKRNGV